MSRTISLRTLLLVQSETARVLTETPRPEAPAALLELLGTMFDCSVATAWEVQRAKQELHYLAGWCPPEPRLQSLLEASRAVAFGRGEGPAGPGMGRRAYPLASTLPTPPDWPPSAEWARADLRAGLAFPILSPTGTTGVVELAGTENLEPTEDLLTALEALGRRLGQWTERLHAEAELRDRQARHAAILPTAAVG